MFNVQEEAGMSEKVILAALYLPRREELSLFEEDLEEMKTLIDTAGAEVMDTLIQKRDKPRFSTWFGKGKIEEIKQRMIETDCKTVVIDAELKPSQIMNIEKELEAKVIDRSQLILDIFSLHAKTNEAKIQVELAQLEIMYPRLTNMWGHLSRQDGGIGTRGPGETQLETDRRLVQKKISILKKRLKKIEKSREIQRSGRSDLFRCAIVGYTNVGKSTLLNAMSGSDVLVQNKLFATLDTSSRKTFLPGAGEVVISDTVGFLRKLPHHLVASFKSTLEVALEADLLLIVMDASSEWFSQQMDTVREVLKDLKAGNKPAKIIFNKIDLLDDPIKRKKIEIEFPEASYVSALDKNSVLNLKQEISETIVEVKLDMKKEHAIKKETKRYISVG